MNRLRLLILTLTFCALQGLHAQRAEQTDADFSLATDSVSNDLNAALQQLSQLSDSIAEEKIPLARELRELEEQILQRRDDVRQLQADTGLIQSDSQQLSKELEAKEKRLGNLFEQLDDYVRLFESRIHISELSQYKDVIETGLAAGREEAMTKDRLSPQLKTIEESLNRLESLLGGIRFDGSALSANGTLEKGKFSKIGPITLFASSESTEAGLARHEINSMEASLQLVPEPHQAPVRSIVESGNGMLPLDPTDGEAFENASTEETLIEHLARGGIVMIPILLLALLAALIAIWKTIELSRIRSVEAYDVQSVLDHLSKKEKEEADQHANKIGGPGGQILSIAIQHANASKELLEEVLLEQILHIRPRLEKMLQFINLTAAIAPLLGLLGTVTGMIHTFQLITVNGTGDAKTLSSGISEALITTEIGLIVAVGALLVHGILSRRVKNTTASLERAAVSFVNGLALQKSAKAPA